MLDDAIAADDGRPFLSHWDGDASGSGIFDDDDNMADNDEEDGFNLLTQSNDLFKQDHATSDSDSDNGEGSDDSSSSSGSSSCSSSSSEEDIKGESLEQLRAKNIRRNEAFANKLKLEMHAMLSKDEANLKNRRVQQKKRQAREVVDPTKSMSPVIRKQGKCRGMIFATKSNGMLYQEGVQQLRQTTLAQELNEKYPHRSKQIYYLCARLQSIVSRTEMAWKMNENVRSYGESNYSEASYSGRVKMSAPSPILISGAGGTGKTSIVCDAIRSLRERTNSSGGGLSMYRIVSNAYVDCASAESNSVTSVMNNAYKQIYECYHSNDSAVSRKRSHRKRTRTVGRDVKTDEIGTTTSISERLSQADHSMDGANDIDCDDSDNDYDDDGDFDEEDLIERQRKRRGVVKKKRNKRQSVAGTDKSSTGHTRQTRQSIAQQSSDQSAVVAANQSIALKNPVYTQESSAVAIFGRAISSILQGDTSKKRAPQNGRCVFFILDNADRILSWNKSRRNNPLAELLLLPKIMGINLTLILISRSTLYQYSRVQKPPGTILDAVQPNQIYFDAYSSVGIIKDIMRLPRIQHMVTGRANLTRHKHECVVSNLVRVRFEQLCYSSLLGWSISSVKGSTHDLTEIIRLSRFLWPEYISPLDGSTGSIDPKFKAPMWQVLCYLKKDVVESSVINCNCSSCVCIASAVDTGRVGVEFAVLKQRLFEKLDNSIRETMRDFLSTAVLMPSRVLRNQISKPYAERLPYVTKFLLLAAFLCQNKKAESDKNLFTKKNTGKLRRDKTDLGSSYASSSTELKQLTVRQPSFPIERLLSVFYSIMGSYGQNGGSTNDVSDMGSERLFKNISQLSATGLIRRVGRSNISLGKTKDVTEMTSAKFSCSLSREDADLIAKSVGFPLDKYCP